MKSLDKIFEKMSIKEMLERIEKKESIIVPSPEDSIIKNPEDYIILPGRKHGSYYYPDLLVSKEVYHKGLNWKQCHEELRKEDSFMLTPRQFADFLMMLKYEDKVYNGKGYILDSAQTLQIYKEITEVRDPYRAEWLDAKFTKQGNDFYINYHILRNNVLNPITEKFEDCVMKDKQINLGDYLARANFQGLPILSTKKGSLYYECPVDGAVVRFGANSDGAGLACNWAPATSLAGLGVRRAKKLGVKIQ